MSAPIISWYESDDKTPFDIDSNPVSDGDVMIGQTSDPVTVNIWNNKDGTSTVANMHDITLAVLTATGLITGDTDANGQEIVTDKWVQVKDLEVTDDVFLSIGGETVKSLTDISGAVGGNKTGIRTRVVVPDDVNALKRSCLMRLYYNYG